MVTFAPTMRRLALTALAAMALAGLLLAPTGVLAQNDTNETDTTPEAGPGTATFEVRCDQLRCTFDASNATMANTSIASYDWAFGDGSSGSGEVTEHTYVDVGTYDVTLTLEGADGTSTNQTRTVNATADRHGNDDTVPWSALGVGAIALVGSIVIARTT